MATEKVSGTGKYAKRIDQNISKRTTQPIRDMGSTKYGEGKALMEQQQGAKLQGQPTKIPKIDANAATAGAGTLPLTAETQRPNESPDTGMPFGEGPGPADIGLNLGTGDVDSPQKQDLQKLSNYLPMIERAANSEDAPESLRTFVKYLKGQPGQIAPTEQPAPAQEPLSPSQEM
jgi:hypothetical protein